MINLRRRNWKIRKQFLCAVYQSYIDEVSCMGGINYQTLCHSSVVMYNEQQVSAKEKYANFKINGGPLPKLSPTFVKNLQFKHPFVLD